MNLQVFEGNGTREASQDIKKKKRKKKVTELLLYKAKLTSVFIAGKGTTLGLPLFSSPLID